MTQHPTTKTAANDLYLVQQTGSSNPFSDLMGSLETGNRQGALELLRAMLESFPDTKVIEDLHQRIRCDSLKNSNRKHTALEVQNIVMTSKMLETRGIAHPAALPDLWVQTTLRFLEQVAVGEGRKNRRANSTAPPKSTQLTTARSWPTSHGQHSLLNL